MKSVVMSVASAGLLLAMAGPAFAGKDEKTVDPRQGEKVNQVCFAGSISGWRENGRRSILINRGVNDWYKLDLAGACDPDWAFGSIGLETWAGSGCISRGDKIHTNDSNIPGTCVITGIYKWNEDAVAEESDETSEE